MKHTYEKVAVDVVKAGDKPNVKYCPNLIEEGSFANYQKHGFVVVGKATVTVEFLSPDEIHKGQLTALKEQLQATRAENQQRENAILDQISKLSALTFVEAA